MLTSFLFIIGQQIISFKSWMKLKVKMIVRVPFPSHSLLVSSFLFLPWSLLLSCALPISCSSSCQISLSQARPLVSFLFHNVSFSQSFFFTSSFFSRLSLISRLLTSFHGYSMKLESTSSVLKTWWTQTWKDIMVKSTIWHCEQDRSTLRRITFNNVPPIPQLPGNTFNSQS